MQGNVLIFISRLFLGQGDIEADTRRLTGEGPFVDRFRQSRPTAADDAESGIGQAARDFLGEFVIGMIGRQTRRWRDACRP